MFNPFGSGGHALYTRELLDAIAEAGATRGVSPSLVAAEDLAPEYHSDRYPIHRILPRLSHRSEHANPLSWASSRVAYHLGRGRAFLDWLDRRDRVDVVHFQDVNAWVAPGHFRAIRRRGTAVVYTVHNIYEHKDDRGPVWRIKSRWWRSAWRECNLLIVHTEGLRDALADFLGPGRPPIRVAPHGVWGGGGPAPRPSRREGDASRLLFFGVIRKNKGLHVLLDAMKDLPGASLVVAGSPEDAAYMDQARALIAGLPEGRVELIDRVVDESEVAGLFARSDLLVLPYTRYTAQSGVLFLAMAHGLPVVAADAGGLGESVRAWGAGEVVAPGDARALALGVRAALEPARHRAAAESIVRARRGLTWAETASKTIDAYRLLGGSGE